MTPADRDEAMRVLGARDGYAGALLKVRNQIAHLQSCKPDDRHTRKRAIWVDKLAPLLTLERMFDEQRVACLNAYHERSAQSK